MSEGLITASTPHFGRQQSTMDEKMPVSDTHVADANSTSEPDVEKAGPVGADAAAPAHPYAKYQRPVTLALLAATILGWWICATILPATRHRWIVQTLFAWSFIAIIAFRYIPTSIVTRPIEAVWVPLVQDPFLRLPSVVRFTMGWLALLAIIFGSAFGFSLQAVSNASVLLASPARSDPLRDRIRRTVTVRFLSSACLSSSFASGRHLPTAPPSNGAPLLVRGAAASR
jgi:CNT family concentrative nucleoside transporter